MHVFFWTFYYVTGGELIIFEAKQINFIRRKSGSAAFLEILSLKPSLTIEITQNKTKKKERKALVGESKGAQARINDGYGV